MDSLTFALFLAAAALTMSLASYFFGWLAVEAWRPILPFKPFSCRPCMTFWLTVLLHGVATLLIAPYAVRAGHIESPALMYVGFGGVGILFGIIEFLYLKRDVYD